MGAEGGFLGLSLGATKQIHVFPYLKDFYMGGKSTRKENGLSTSAASITDTYYHTKGRLQITGKRANNSIENEPIRVAHKKHI